VVSVTDPYCRILGFIDRHYVVTDIETGDSITAVAREQLCGHVVSPATR
jgi:hypothetical protein